MVCIQFNLPIHPGTKGLSVLSGSLGELNRNTSRALIFKTLRSERAFFKDGHMKDFVV